MSTMSVSSTNRNPFAQLVYVFADDIARNFSLSIPAQSEDQLKAPISQLLSAVGNLEGLEVGTRTEVRDDDVGGRPDIGVVTGGLLTGHVELKSPGTGACAEHFTGHNREQWLRFKALPNLIYTDGSEWSLYRSGQLVKRVRISDDVSASGSKNIDRDALTELRLLLVGFLRWNPVVPATAQGLAGYLAPLARILRDEVQVALGRAKNPLSQLADEWSGLLFPEGDEAQFADAYAQTLTYALLLAKFEGAESLRPAMAVDTLQQEHRLLAEALQLLEAAPVRDELEMPIELLERAIGAVNAENIRGDGDPWLYFYEQFLGSYDPKLRKDRGVYFTPVEVVQVQVKLAGELLRNRFGKQLAYASDEVVVLDPAAGTGTYPLAVLGYAAEAVRERMGPGAVPERLRALAERLYAFEILVGPYSVAHLRLSQELREAGVTDIAPKMYLTDTLESPNLPPTFTASIMQMTLTNERVRALEVKKDTRVFVCLGNPPYDREERDPLDDTGQRKGGWVRYGDYGEDQPEPILEDFLAPAREAGQGVHLKNLYNDYVYFWRWALWKVLDSTKGPGIVTFITASSYLKGPGFGGMRRKMRAVFDELWIIDLEGDNLGARKSDNIFAIQTPVAIAIGVRNGAPQSDVPARVWKTRLVGSANQKLAALDDVNSFNDLDWHECAEAWDDPFYPSGAGAYFGWPPVTDVFPWQHNGVQLKRTWPIGENKSVLEQRWKRLLALSRKKQRDAFRETGDRKVDGRYLALAGNGLRESPISELRQRSALPEMVPYAYRALDRHWVIADSRVGDRIRPELWRAHSDNQVYITSLLTNVLGKGPAAVATSIVPDLDHFRGSFGAKHVIPLWRDPDATQPNVTNAIVEAIGDAHGEVVPAERLFAYAYGILAQPAYVEQFWDELELPPPHLPITKDHELFARVADHGARLLYLHTYGARFAGPDDDGAVPQGSARYTVTLSPKSLPDSFAYDPTTQVLTVGDGKFAPVAREIWDYSISGFQVVDSWLGRRMIKRSGKSSSPLDKIRPKRWEFTEELLELLWVIEATLILQPEGEALLEEVFASEIFHQDELPRPTDEERRPPQNVVATAEQVGLLANE